MTLGLDTSVVVRLLVGLPAAQARAARQRIERAVDEGEIVLVSDIVIAESYFALQHHYDVPKAEARQLLLRFVDSGVVELEPPGARHALAAQAGPGLVDRFVHGRYRARGAVTVTFDARLARLQRSVST